MKLIEGKQYYCEWGMEIQIIVTFLYMDNDMAVVEKDREKFYVYPEDLSEIK
jgi:hypothetical protein